MEIINDREMVKLLENEKFGRKLLETLHPSKRKNGSDKPQDSTDTESLTPEPQTINEMEFDGYKYVIEEV